MIYTFAQFNLQENSATGGKAHTLARLFQAGYPVPDGFIIPATAFHNEELPAHTWFQVNNHLARLRQEAAAIALAVRSSAIQEDSAQTSFAGEFETVLNVRTDDEVRQAIQTVYQSRHNERVRAYSQAHGVETNQGVAVIVQKMVPAEMAGVLFTADPVSGSHRQMVGHFVFGLGEGLVSGEANGQPFTLQRPNGHYEGDGALAGYGRQLYRLATRLENELGGPQDIEWAVADGKLYILQSRPITTMQAYNPVTGEWNDSLRGDFLWTATNLGEAVPDIMTPLTWSVLQIYAQEAFNLPLPGNHPLFGNIAGRFYLNVSLFASFMQSLGFSRQRVAEEIREFFGQLPDDLDIPLIPFSRRQLLMRFLAFVPGAWLGKRRNLKALPTFLARTPAAMAVIRSHIAGAATPDQLASIWLEQLDPFFRQVCQLLKTTTGRFEDLARPLRKELTRQVGEIAANTLLSGFSNGRDQLESLGPVVGLWRVTQGEMSRKAYLDQYGHRGPHEFELSLPRPAENPAWMEQQLAGLDEVDVPALLARQEAVKKAAWEQYARQYPRRAKSMQARLTAVAEAARAREKIRSEAVRALWLIRDFVLRAATLTGQEDDLFFLSLDELYDYLRGEGSLLAAVAARRATHQRFTALPTYPTLISGRFDPYQWAQDPQRRADLYLANGKPAANDSLEAATDNLIIKGFPGAAGVVEGIVRRLDRPEEGPALQKGEILVTGTTNIGWTPLFPRAAAIVTDVGAPLSHAAIVARELAIPAVVGSGNATRRLKTGDRVRVNGSRGTVEILF